ncbi:c-type cytochrome [Methylobacterium nodulans]|uniref:Putative sulfite:cytochrome c oxidoreductase subunit B n=1 Tax=Methylobacterium nodulans (strain LMG 21967 / CNCM I-2342 / ORS 2060) TaxID=460265 RepID=B8IWD9_METNO|nr:cytochrome c [Methylobacterium nodulans]ACL62729.1 putative sulfite:cytochrome c oxidoreductase subunit B [Methylobacterium nodulans ORS 2060]
MTSLISRLALVSLAILGLSCAAAWIESARAKPMTYDLPEETSKLRPGAGVEVAEAHCLTCHSPDYIAMQPGGKGRAFWAAEISKMLKAYGAPISDDDAKTITDYLATTYP